MISTFKRTIVHVCIISSDMFLLKPMNQQIKISLSTQARRHGHMKWAGQNQAEELQGILERAATPCNAHPKIEKQNRWKKHHESQRLFCPWICVFLQRYFEKYVYSLRDSNCDAKMPRCKMADAHLQHRMVPLLPRHLVNNVTAAGWTKLSDGVSHLHLKNNELNHSIQSKKETCIFLKFIDATSKSYKN